MPLLKLVLGGLISAIFFGI